MINLISGIGMIAAGVWMILDDIKDFGKFSYPGHPSPIHHWQHGLVLLILGLIMCGLAALDLIMKMEEGRSHA